MSPPDVSGPRREPGTDSETIAKRLDPESSGSALQTTGRRPRDERGLHPLDSGVVYAVALYRPAYDGMRREKRRRFFKSAAKAYRTAERWAATNFDGRVAVFRYRISDEEMLVELVPSVGPYSRAHKEMIARARGGVASGEGGDG